jgi:hypothetical protein
MSGALIQLLAIALFQPQTPRSFADPEAAHKTPDSEISTLFLAGSWGLTYQVCSVTGIS